MNTVWTPQKDERLRGLARWNDGFIAKQLGVTSTAVENRRRRLGIKKYKPRISWTPGAETQVKLFATGLRDSEIGKRLGVSGHSIRSKRRQMRIFKKQQIEWNEERIHLLRLLFAAGYEDSFIAERLGKTRPAVMSKRRRLGLTGTPRSKVNQRYIDPPRAMGRVSNDAFLRLLRAEARVQ